MLNSAYRIDYLAGWRLLYSKQFRDACRDKWKHQPLAMTALEVSGLVVTALAALIFFVVMANGIWVTING